MLLHLLLVWAASAAASVLLFTMVSLALDRSVFFSHWVLLALGVMAILGPLGTLLTATFVIDTALAVCRQRRLSTRAAGHSPAASSCPLPLVSGS